jgi:molybdopterin-guanine dinucleotide biosynthesis protein A
MGGIAACLAATDAPLLVVLGVDMPMVPGELLRRMASAATIGCGVAVRREAEGGRWLWEPLAAVWPRVALGRVEAALGEGRLSLQRLMDELAGAGMMREWGEAVPAEWLANANTPEEWAALGRAL